MQTVTVCIDGNIWFVINKMQHGTLQFRKMLHASNEVGLETNAEKTNVHVSSPDYRTKSLAYIG
jgi:hypothetical protein